MEQLLAQLVVEKRESTNLKFKVVALAHHKIKKRS